MPRQGMEGKICRAPKARGSGLPWSEREVSNLTLLGGWKGFAHTKSYFRGF